MPCGGIVISNEGHGPRSKKLSPTVGGCWVCGRGGCKHFLIEWDSFIHATCAVKALNDPQSDVYMVISHKHEVYLDFSIEEPES